MITVAETTMNAARVPMLTRSQSFVIGSSAARIAMNVQVTNVFLIGDSVRWSTSLKTLGSMPSRPMANRIRVWP